MIQNNDSEEEVVTDLPERRGSLLKYKQDLYIVEIFPSWKSKQQLWELCEEETKLLTNEYSLKSFSFDSGVKE